MADILQRNTDGFMPKGMKRLNDVYALQRQSQWPVASGVWGFGPNENGQSGKVVDTNGPRRGLLVSNHKVISLASAFQDTSYLYAGGMYVRDDNTLWAFGFNYSNYLGLPAQGHYPATQVGTLTDWAQVYCTGQASWIALKTNGEMWSIGQGSGGRLFNGGTANQTVWTKVQAGTTWKKIAVGVAASGSFAHMMAIRSDGTLWTVGTNQGGKTGLGSTTGSTTVPTQVGTATDWADVACSGQSTSAIKTNGTLWTWGSSLYGVSGGATTPSQWGAETDWAYINGGVDYTMFYIKTNGRAYRSGQNTTIQAGAGSSPTAAAMQNFDGANGWTWKWIATAGNYVVGMRTDGKLFFSGNGVSSPWPSPVQNPQNNLWLLEELGTVPPTTIANAGTSTLLIGY